MMHQLWRDTAYLDDYRELAIVDLFADTFNAKDTSAWAWSSYQTVPYNDAGNNVAQSTGTGANWNANVTRNGYTLRTGQSVQLRFKVTSTATDAHFTVEANDPALYRRFGVIAGSTLYVQYQADGANWVYPGNVLSSLLANTWYVVKLTIDDYAGFRVEAWQESNPAVRGSFQVAMPSGKTWRFMHQLYRDTAYLDDYREFGEGVQSVGFRYDQATWPDGTALPGGKGRQTSTVSPASVTYVGYDPRGRTTQTKQWVGALGPQAVRTIGSAYDSADRLTGLTYPTGEVVTYGYDAGWRQTSACSSLGGCYASGAAYNALDEPTNWTYGNGLGQSVGYDALGRMTSGAVGSGGSTFNHTYTYDNVGNVLTNGDVLAGQTQNFQYDHRDRLTHAWTTGSATAAYDETTQYSAIGNIAAKGPTGSLATYGYGASGAGSVRPHAVTAVGAQVYGYDADGNLTSRNGRPLTWYGDNTLAAAVGVDGVAEGYAYDATGQRVTRSRNIGQLSGTVTTYVGGLYEEDVPSGTIRVLYQLAGKVVAQRTIAGGSPTVAYLHGDALGSTSATTSGSGVTTATQWYTPWGTVRAGGGLPTAIGFTGQRQDGTGLLYYGARYYDPGIGRFASADDIAPGKEDPQARNRYSYVLNNPLRYIDPTGRCSEVPSEAPQDDENRNCQQYQSYLKGYGVRLVNYHRFMAWQLEVMWGAVTRFASKILGDFSGDTFKRVMGVVSLERVEGDSVPWVPGCNQNGVFQCASGSTLYITDFGVQGGAGNWANIQRTSIHELAHIMDFALGGAPSSTLQSLTRSGRDCANPVANAATCYVTGDANSPKAIGTHMNAKEDWAEAVAWYAMWDLQSNSPDMDGPRDPQSGVALFVNSNRWQYVQCVGAGGAAQGCAQQIVRGR